VKYAKYFPVLILILPMANEKPLGKASQQQATSNKQPA
jgi:hypothetical protein